MKRSLHDSEPIRWRDVWSLRDMRIALPARALSLLGDTVAVSVLMLDAAESRSASHVTGILAAFAAPLLLLAAPAGRLVDSRDSRTLLVSGGLLQVLASAGLVWSPSYAAQLGFVVLLQCGQVVTGPTWLALIPRIVGESRVATAIAMSQTLGAVAGLVGFAVGGTLYDRIGPHWTMSIDTASFALLVVAALLVSTRRAVAQERGPAGATGPCGGTRAVLADRVIALFLLSLLLFVTTAEASNVAEPILIVQDLGADGTAYGLVGSYFAAGSILGPTLAGRIRTQAGRLSGAVVTMLAVGAVLAYVGTVRSVAALVPAYFAFGIAVGVLNVLISTVLMLRAPEAIRGRVMSLVSGAARGASMLGLLLGGALVAGLGGRQAYVVLGIASAAVAPLALLARRQLRGEPTARPAHASPVPADPAAEVAAS
ncbi:hypothetical protein N864_21855 [Intrasporangium chromatireducens Q5-1]|uniref:Major facilitator superfamily (MFS) profile domain-containing protein n=1 Tax=Intrasporangium chromatireducens Q5-1 TaxID=584657 RepID=W9GKX0_9MICO|nr:MFS transporter [Intrasporangium chromatireducens]EWT05772.1 hypothetical protein N864_21855 [Intrasporangium chromatireducens Q5-1]